MTCPISGDINHQVAALIYLDGSGLSNTISSNTIGLSSS
jgi:hypothetical protein